MRKVILLILGFFVIFLALFAMHTLRRYLASRQNGRAVSSPAQVPFRLPEYFIVPGYEDKLVRDDPVIQQGSNASTSVQYDLGRDFTPGRFVEALESHYATLGWEPLEYDLLNPGFRRGRLPEWDLWPGPQSRPAEPIWKSSWVRAGEILSVDIVRIAGNESGNAVCVLSNIAHFQGAYALQLLANYRAHHPLEVLSQHSTDGQQNADERNANDDP